MKNFKPGISLFFYAVLLLVTCATCKKKDNDDGFTIKAGDWTGTDISFVVGGDPRKITSMEFTYSGHASGSSCSFDYETTVSFGFDVDIEDNSFSLSLSDYESMEPL